MTLTHSQLAAYIQSSGLGGTRFSRLFRRSLTDTDGGYQGTLPPDAFLFFSPQSAVAYATVNQLHVTFSWKPAVYYPEDPTSAEAGLEYMAAGVRHRMTQFIQRIDKAQGASLFSRASPAHSLLNIHRGPDNTWYSPSATRLRTLDWALDGLVLLPEQQDENTEERIRRLSFVGRLVTEGMPAEYAQEAGR